MFRHPILKYRLNPKDDFLENISINQLIRYYRVPSVMEKQDVLNLLQQKISTNTYSQSKSNTNVRRLITIGSIAAAASIIFLFLYFSAITVSYQNKTNMDSAYFFPDRSRVILTPGSKVKYAKTLFSRNVNLDGTGYFEVQKGIKFKVKTSDGMVTVLGTRFTVSEIDNALDVNCYEGSVKVNYKNDERLLVLGQKVEAMNKSIGFTEKFQEKYPEIAYFKKSYANTSISDVCNDMEKYFGIKIELSTSGISHFSGTFYAPEIETVLEILCTPFNLDYKILADGTYQIYSQKSI